MMNKQISMEINSRHLEQLFTALSTANTELIANLQAQLVQLSFHPQFLSTLLNLSLSNNGSQYVVKMSVVYTSTYAKNILSSSHPTQINTVCSQLIQYISQSNAQLELKKHVATTLQYILNQESQKELGELFMQSYLQLIQSSSTSVGQKINFQYIGLLGEIVMKSKAIKNQNVEQFIRKSIVNFFTLNYKLLQYGKPQSPQILQEWLQLCKIYSQILKGYINRFMLISLNISDILSHQTFLSIIRNVLSISLPYNSIDSSLIFLNSQTKTTNCFHKIKSNYINIFRRSLNLLCCVDPMKVNGHPLITLAQQFIIVLVKSVKLTLQKSRYYEIKSDSIIKVIEESYKFFTEVLRSKLFYGLFASIKQEILECICLTLDLSPLDYHQYRQNPDQFINSMNHVIDIKAFQEKKQKKEDDIEIYSTVKTSAAQVLDYLCSFIDGTLTQIFNSSMIALSNPPNRYSYNLHLILINILSKKSKQRTDIHIKLSSLLCRLLESLRGPKIQYKQQENIFYSLVMLTILRYLSHFSEVHDTIIEKMFAQCQKLIQEEEIDEVPKMIAYQMVICCWHFQQAASFYAKYLSLFNNVLKTRKNSINHKLLQSLSFIFKFNDFNFKSNKLLVLQCVGEIVSLLIFQLKKGKQKISIKESFAWNVLQQIVESLLMHEDSPSEKTHAQIIAQIHQNLAVFFQWLHVDKVQFEERLFKIFTMCVKGEKKVSEIEIKLFFIIINFYHSLLPQAFQFIQSVIFFGSPLLVGNSQQLKTLLQSSIAIMSSPQEMRGKSAQSYNCIGVLMIQTLMVECGKAFDSGMWVMAFQNTLKRLNQPSQSYLKTNLLINLSLALLYGKGFFSSEDCCKYFSSILTSVECFQGRKQSKIMVIILSQYFRYFEEFFVSQNFLLLLDCLVGLLSMDIPLNGLKLKKKQELQYDECYKKMINGLTGINELQYFKREIKNLGDRNGTLVEGGYNGLGQTKKRFLRELMCVRKVGDQRRKILKIKK